MIRRLLIALLILLPVLITTLRAEPLNAYRMQSRVLVVFFSDCTLRDGFERNWAAAAKSAKERNLVILRADGELRSSLKIGENANIAILIGKDGTEKKRWDKPPTPDEVFKLIDSMPMRQQEMQSRP